MPLVRTLRLLFRTCVGTPEGHFQGTTCQIVRERPPGLLQHVLTVLVFWSWVLLRPRLPPSPRSLKLFPWPSILLHGPLDICLDLLPAAPRPPMQKRDAQHMFLRHRGARACFLLGKWQELLPCPAGQLQPSTMSRTQRRLEQHEGPKRHDFSGPCPCRTFRGSDALRGSTAPRRGSPEHSPCP